MANFNKVVLVGNLTADPVAKGKDGDVASFSVAVNENDKKKTVNFVPCVAFGKTGELCLKYLKCGKLVLIEGKFISNSYVNKEKKRVTSYGVAIFNVQFLDSKKDADTRDPAADEATEGDIF